MHNEFTDFLTQTETCTDFSVCQDNKPELFFTKYEEKIDRPVSEAQDGYISFADAIEQYSLYGLNKVTFRVHTKDKILLECSVSPYDNLLNIMLHETAPNRVLIRDTDIFFCGFNVKKKIQKLDKRLLSVLEYSIKNAIFEEFNA